MFTKHDFQFTRGDTFTFGFKREDEDGNIVSTPIKEIYFTVKRNWYVTPFLIQKKYSDGGITFDASENLYKIEIEPSETAELEYGVYNWDIQLIYADDSIYTGAKGNITLLDETTFVKDRD